MSTLDLEESNVQNIQYVNKNNQHFYLLTLVSRGAFCPECRTFSKKIHGYKDKKINHSILLKENLTIVYHQRRYKCPNCSKTFVESDPFTSHHCRFSNKTIDNVLNLLKDYNQTFSSVSRLTGVSITEVIEIFDEYVQIDRKKLQEVICIDEFYFSRKSKYKYACMLVGFKNGLIIDVLESRKKSKLRSYFRLIPEEERNTVKFVSMDMYDNYRDIAHKYFPNALCCADSFHVIKYINDALDKIRCKVMNRYKNDKNSDEYYLLKYKNKLLYIDSLKISDSFFKYNKHFKCKTTDGALLEQMLNIDNELKHAYELKELYMIFNESTSDIVDIAKELDAVIAAYMVSGIPGFISIGETLSNWKEEIINSFHTYDGRRINNGPIEGRNKYIHIILELANGYKNFKRFRHRALFVLNKHESPLKEPRDTSLIKLPGKERGPYNKKSKFR